jgi:hypothetical protein
MTDQNDRFIDVFKRAIAGGPQVPAPPDTGGAMTRRSTGETAAAAGPARV